MNRKIIFILFMALTLISCNKINIDTKQTKQIPEEKAQPVQETVQPAEKANEKIKSVTVKNKELLNIKMIQDMNFNTVILQTEGVRYSSKPYKTDNRTLRTLGSNTAELERSNMDYFIEVVSGPGLSSDGEVFSISESNTEKFYFSKMISEIVKRYGGNKHFRGISVMLQNPYMTEKDYYNSLDYIIQKVREQYPDLMFMVNFYPLSFENKLENVPELKWNNIVVNFPIQLNSFVYPGKSKGIASEIDLDKNSMLRTLQKLKESHYNNMVISLNIPWTEASDVFLQDIFEINKMLGFDYNIIYGNSGDMFDFSYNEGILKILKRHNQE